MVKRSKVCRTVGTPVQRRMSQDLLRLIGLQSLANRFLLRPRRQRVRSGRPSLPLRYPQLISLPSVAKRPINRLNNSRPRSSSPPCPQFLSFLATCVLRLPHLLYLSTTEMTRSRGAWPTRQPSCGQSFRLGPLLVDATQNSRSLGKRKNQRHDRGDAVLPRSRWAWRARSPRLASQWRIPG
jgi:hypothetical protein